MRSHRALAAIITLAVVAGGLLAGAGTASASPSATSRPTSSAAVVAVEKSIGAPAQLARGYQGPFGTFDQCYAENQRWSRTHVVNECFYWGGSGSPTGWYFYVFGPR
ncbi:hypothetical protein GCM10009544_00400 [Streptomyces stramineus]|uniref:Uncharacterized protein n=1 Tax=Streptomyces stramineus TaxID=173861 RepID=A0ABN0ZAQ3_9ACTN